MPTPATPPTRYPSRRASVGGTEVARPLPQRTRRTVGHWCFVDLFTPGVGTAPDAAMGVGPHPHCGLQTLTWLTGGSLHHTDSLGSSQRIEPGQLNLMTAGSGITHAEAAVADSGPVHGAQLWLAQPEATRHDPPRFAHHVDLPSISLGDGLDATLVVGSIGSTRSPAEVDADALLLSVTSPERGIGTLDLDRTREHAVVVLDGSVVLQGTWFASEPGADPEHQRSLDPGTMAVLDPGHEELSLRVASDTRLLVLGGAPIGEELVMWWNFVVRTRAEALEAAEAWNRGDARFGPQPPSPDPRATAPLPPWRASVDPPGPSRI